MRLGVFTEEAKLYHAEKGYISSSPLRKMRKSPAHFYAAWAGPSADSSHEQEKGTAVHSLILEQDIARYARRPVKADGELVRSNSKEYKEWEASLAPGQVAVAPEFYDNFNAMLDAFCSNKKAMEILEHGKVEKSIYAQDPETGLYIKARPDIWGSGYKADLKSTTNMDMFEKTIYQHGYDYQGVHYEEVDFACTGEVTDHFFFIAFEVVAPFAIKIFELHKDDRKRCKGQRRLWLNEIAACHKDNHWPGYAEEIITTTRPAYMTDDEVSFSGVG